MNVILYVLFVPKIDEGNKMGGPIKKKNLIAHLHTCMHAEKNYSSSEQAEREEETEGQLNPFLKKKSFPIYAPFFPPEEA